MLTRRRKLFNSAPKDESASPAGDWRGLGSIGLSTCSRPHFRWLRAPSGSSSFEYSEHVGPKRSGGCRRASERSLRWGSRAAREGGTLPVERSKTARGPLVCEAQASVVYALSGAGSQRRPARRCWETVIASAFFMLAMSAASLPASATAFIILALDTAPR